MKPEQLQEIEKSIRVVPDFPKPGIHFRDISTLLANPYAFHLTVQGLLENTRDILYNVIVGAESRGFLFAAPMAHQLAIPLVMVRKKGKLPGKVVRQKYQLEYGTDTIEIQKGIIPKGARVLIVDDLLATGGTVEAIAELVRKAGGQVAGLATVIDLPDLGGSKKLSKEFPVRSLVQFSGE